MTAPDFISTQSRKIAKAVLAGDETETRRLLAELEVVDAQAARNVALVLKTAAGHLRS